MSRTLKHLQQPDNSNLCGQTCVAMITGRPLQDVIDVIGRGGTHFTGSRKANLQKAFTALGKGTLGPVIQLRSTTEGQPPMKGTYIVRIRWSQKPQRSHFVVLHNGVVYDPGWPRLASFQEWLQNERDFHGDPYLNIASWAEWRPKRLEGWTTTINGPGWDYLD